MSLRRIVLLSIALAFALPGGVADAGKKSRKRLNMPDNWTWPPSHAMKEAGAACLERLDELGVVWQKAPRARKVATPVYVPDMTFGGVVLEPIWRKGPFVMDCHLAMSLATIAPELRKLGVAKLRFSTIHQFRYIRKNQRSYKILSRHSLGLAMDVYEMVTDDGQVHVVKKHYRRKGQTLRAVEKVTVAAGVFRALLTPGNDRRSHHDHFHFEAAMPIPGAKLSLRSNRHGGVSFDSRQRLAP